MFSPSALFFPYKSPPTKASGGVNASSGNPAIEGAQIRNLYVETYKIR